MAPRLLGGGGGGIVGSTTTTAGSTGGTTTTTNNNNYNPFVDIGSSNSNAHYYNHHNNDAQQQQWVNVTWMPHTALSQTSHVCLTIHSAHVVIPLLDDNYKHNNTPPPHHHSPIVDQTTTRHSADMEWQVRIGIYGIGNLPLVPIQTYTKSATLMKRTRTNMTQHPTTTSSSSSSSLRRIITIQKATHQCIWDYFTNIPMRWRDLPRDAFLLFEIGHCVETKTTNDTNAAATTTTTTSTSIASMGMEVLYHTTLPFFTQYGTLMTGLHKLHLRRGSVGTVGHYYSNAPNLGLTNYDGDDNNNTNDDVTNFDPVWKAVVTLDQLQRIQQQEARQQQVRTNHPITHKNTTTIITTTTSGNETTYNNSRNSTFGRIPSVPWLDTMMKERALQVIHDSYCVDSADLLLLDSNHAYLIIELPHYDIPILYDEVLYPISPNGACGAVTPIELAAYRKRMSSSNHQLPDDTNYFDPLQVVSFLDYENENDNPIEDKYRTLAHDLLRGLVDPALKPDREQRNRLANIIDAPSHHPSREEKDLLWRFRFSLVDNRRALAKFLLAVDWTMESEVVQAAELLEQWRRRSPIEVTDALKLLGKHVAFQTNLVRDYAIDTLAVAPDSELRLYLLQLVQALKYENIQPQQQRIDTPSTQEVGTNGIVQVSSLATFLIHRAAGNIELANYLYWYLKVELEDPTFGGRYRDVFNALESCLSQTPYSIGPMRETQHPSLTSDDMASQLTKSIVDSVSKLGSSLRKGEVQCTTTNDHDTNAASLAVKERTMWSVLVEQDRFISGVMDVQLRCRDSRGKKDAKEAELKSLLSKEGFDRKVDRDPVPLPSRPDIFVNGVRPETAIMFKSALYPALLEFHVEGIMPTTKEDDVDINFTSYKVIVKTGDDLRQDQLIIMMIQLMDKLLKRGALDLCLTPYSIIATSTTSGLVEFVDQSMPISQVLSKSNGSILQFFQSVAAQKGSKYDVRPDVMSVYIRSCAGYCVITYLLGVGDRHLDNIMLRTSGHFFHIDFGFIFGRDPKPLPPAFRLTREMVDGMGGFDSNEYRQFCSLACQAYNALRKSAGLVLNLLHLMSDAGIDDLSNNPSADADGVIAKVEERFRLDLNDEQAERFFIGLVNDCLTAIAPRVMDVFHSIAVARR